MGKNKPSKKKSSRKATVVIQYGNLVAAQDELTAVFACRPKQGGDALRLTLVRHAVDKALREYQETVDTLTENWGHENPEKPATFHFHLVNSDGEKILEFDGDDDQTGHPVVDVEAFAGYKAAIDELLKTEVEINFKPLDIEGLKPYGYKELPSVNQLAQVFFLFEQGQEFFTPTNPSEGGSEKEKTD